MIALSCHSSRSRGGRGRSRGGGVGRSVVEVLEYTNSVASCQRQQPGGAADDDGRRRGLVAEVSSKFRWIWTSFARDSSFEVLFMGFSGCHWSDRTARPVRQVKTCSGCHDRSDRFVAPVRPVQADSSAICLVLLPRSFLECATVR